MSAAASGGSSLRRLRKRSEFLRVARGSRVGRSAFSLQAQDRAAGDAGLGFTVTKKMGNAPQRNRIRRRLRAAARACAADFVPQHDYVLVGRTDALSQPFGRMVEEMRSALVRIHAKKKS